MDGFSDDKIYLLPYFREEEAAKLYQTLKYARNIHTYLYAKKDQHASMLISKPSYQLFPLADIKEGMENILPVNSYETLVVSSGENLLSSNFAYLTENYKRSFQSLKRLRNSTETLSDQYMAYNDRMIRFLERKEFADKPLPIRTMDRLSNHSLDSSHIKNMGENQRWIIQLINFFKAVTAQQVKVDSALNFDCFLYFTTGDIASFITYDLLHYQHQMETKERVNAHNLQVFKELIFRFADYYGQNDYTASLFNHDSYYMFLMTEFGRKEYPFADFASMETAIRKPYQDKKSHKIGVFLDTANLLTGMQYLKIDYPYLFHLIFGIDQLADIKNLYAAVFYPEYPDDPGKTSYVRGKIKELAEELESFGFSVIPTENGTPKAKQIIDNQELDVDDIALINKMEERIDQYNQILLITGDGHFSPVLKKYADNQVDIKVVSVSKDDTSNELTTNSSIDHHFLTDLWQCVTI